MSHIDEAKPHFERAIDHLAEGLGTIRTGRANPSLVENIQVEAYGSMQPIKAMAAISTPDSRTIRIDPWDGSVVQAIETALQKSDIGIQPTVDGRSIRLNMPMMTEETRFKMVKNVHERLEEGRISIRKIREETRKKMQAEDGVGKDELHRDLESLEKVIKEYMAQIEAMGEKKETELTTI